MRNGKLSRLTETGKTGKIFARSFCYFDGVGVSEFAA